MKKRKLIAELNEKGMGRISVHHKAQGAEMEARIYAGLLGHNKIRKNIMRKLLINNKDLDVVIINGERIK